MLAMTVGEICRALKARLRQGDSATRVLAASIDSRFVPPGAVFVALKGERHDAHDFAVAAVTAGAAALILEREVPGVPPEIPVLLVPDALAALQDLARYNRSRLNLPVVGITGSSGKTTTKDMVAAVLAARFRTLKTRGNFNNEIGLPLTLLELAEGHQAAVVEMAMRGPGEIDALCRLALPTAAVITNIGEAHVELLGTVAAIARAKGEILAHVPADGFALLHGDSPYMAGEAGRCRGRVLFYGLGRDNHFRPEGIQTVDGGNHFEVVFRPGNGEELRFPVFVPVPGRHNVFNALAAVGVGLSLGLAPAEIARGLAGLKLTALRQEVVEAQGMTLINDTYNANPDSARAALQTLAEIARGRRAVAVLGNMLELGEAAAEGHRQVGLASARVAELVFTVGELAAGVAAGAVEGGLSPDAVFLCRDNSEVVDRLRTLLQPGDVVLVKGSRGMQMEEIVSRLTAGSALG